MPFLEVKTPQGKKRLELNSQAIKVGRSPDNDLVISDDLSSRHHCVIEQADMGFRVRDLGSRNGTRLNNAKVAEQLLANGDVVRIGSTELHFIDPTEADPSRPKPRNTPDYATAAAAAANTRDVLHKETLDLDLNQAVTDAQTSYEVKLREMCDAAEDRPFDETDISLIDTRGVTVHQATSSGLESGVADEEDIGEGIRAFRLLLLSCFRTRATDLHMEPRVEKAVVRLRVDGYMITAVEISLSLYKRLLGVIKILCQIDTSSKNQVQEGHFSVMAKGRRVDYRVSMTPAMNGQKLVLRVLDSANAPSRLHELGLLPWMYERLRHMAVHDSGLLLACGPTGSGKTTTLYSCLREIDVDQRNAITIEDPVEYYLEGCTQIPVDTKQGNTFANILRSVLRQDPDVIFVGEVRDIETATVAMQASMTGHLVYTTVHAKDSIGAIFRLLDLGVEAYLVANALNQILAQRLVRMLCETCRKPIKPTPSQSMAIGKSVGGVPYIYAPGGCKKCLGTGYLGRRAIFELLEISDPMRDVILKTPTIQGIRSIAEQGLFTTLRQYGYHLVLDGTTSMDEVERVATME